MTDILFSSSSQELSFGTLSKKESKGASLKNHSVRKIIRLSRHKRKRERKAAVKGRLLQYASKENRFLKAKVAFYFFWLKRICSVTWKIASKIWQEGNILPARSKSYGQLSFYLNHYSTVILNDHLQCLYDVTRAFNTKLSSVPGAPPRKTLPAEYLYNLPIKTHLPQTVF